MYSLIFSRSGNRYDNISTFIGAGEDGVGMKGDSGQCWLRIVNIYTYPGSRCEIGRGRWLRQLDDTTEQNIAHRDSTDKR